MVSANDIKIILSNADTRLKALYLFMLSSGMRRGELSQLKIEDVDRTCNPTRVNIPKEYVKAHKGAKRGRFTFISDEATYYLEQWLKDRPKYIEKTCKRLNKQGIIHKNPDDKTIFPSDASGFQGSLNRLLEKAGAPYNERQMRKGDEEGKPSGRYLFTCHGFRRFFRSNLNEVVPADYVEMLLGHKNYLTDQYRYGYDEKLAEYYLKGMYTLTIFETGISESEVEGIVSDKDAIIRHMQGENEELKKEIAHIWERVKYLPVTTLEKQAQLKKDKEKGNIKELPEPTEADKKKILKDMAKD